MGSDPVVTARFDPLSPRDALSADVATGSRLVFDAGSDATPLLTIAIPTYRRDALLRQALATALGQDLPALVEVIVVDNDPAATGEAARAATLDPARQRLRYVVNDANIGMFGNWNRCLRLARGRWFTLLNDDDLLDPDFARRMLSVLEAAPELDALICRKRVLDERPVESRSADRPSPMATALKAVMFRGRAWRIIGARHLFWGNVIGNSVGLVCRTADLRALGGFDSADYPSADYYVHARLATQYRLGQLAATLVSIRVAQNESMKPEVLYGFLRTGYRMQQALAGTALPVWWGRLSPTLMARHVGELSAGWNVPLDRARVEQETGIVLPPDRGWRVKLMRLLLGGL